MGEALYFCSAILTGCLDFNSRHSKHFILSLNELQKRVCMCALARYSAEDLYVFTEMLQFTDFSTPAAAPCCDPTLSGWSIRNFPCNVTKGGGFFSLIIYIHILFLLLLLPHLLLMN